MLLLFQEAGLRETVGYEQNNPAHNLLLHEHLLATWRFVRSDRDPVLSWAALLHDIGKPQSAWVDNEGRTRYFRKDGFPASKDHAEEGALLAKAILEKHKARNPEEILYLIQHHQWSEDQDAASRSEKSLQKGAQRFLQKHGKVQALRLLRLRHADSQAGKNSPNKDSEAFRLAVLREIGKR